MGQVFGETCLISQINSFFACLGMSCLRTLPIIICACKQVRMIASIDERLRSESAYFRLVFQMNVEVLYLVTIIYTSFFVKCNTILKNFKNSKFCRKNCWRSGESLPLFGFGCLITPHLWIHSPISKSNAL